MAKAALLDYCQAQGPTPCPTQGEGQGQVNSKFGPELYTKIDFHPPTHHLPPSLNEFLVNRVLSQRYLYHPVGPQNDQG